MNILLVDNYDSFTYNLYHEMASITVSVTVCKNDDTCLTKAFCSAFDAIVISPGPKRPKDAGHVMQLMPVFTKKPLLGICLGHQAIGEFFGAKIEYCDELVHGKTHAIIHQQQALFKSVPLHLKAVTYHSLRLSRKAWPSELIQLAHLNDGSVMAFRHVVRPIYGLQFHPESVGTSFGSVLIHNFLEYVKSNVRTQS